MEAAAAVDGRGVSVAQDSHMADTIYMTFLQSYYVKVSRIDRRSIRKLQLLARIDVLLNGNYVGKQYSRLNLRRPVWNAVGELAQDALFAAGSFCVMSRSSAFGPYDHVAPHVVMKWVGE